MAEKFKNKYRIESARLQNWDYRWGGAYFITICTQKREHYFGKIINGKMILSNVGVLANVFWYEIKNHSKNVKLGEFTVMPNHVHGVLILNDSDIINDSQIIGNTTRIGGNRDNACVVSTAIQSRKINWPKPFSKSGEKFRFINCWWLQIRRY